MTLYGLRLFVVMVCDDGYTTIMLDFVRFLVYACSRGLALLLSSDY